jgi:hypothetical protein
MKEVIEAFVEGFKGPFQLGYDLFTAVGKAVATVSSNFVNQTSRPADKEPSN